MKKLFAITLLIAFVSSLSAQNNIPRTGNTPNVDNTGRVLNYIYDSLPTDVAGLDTIYIAPFGYHTQVYINTVLDSVALDIPTTSLANSYKSDVIEIQIVNSSTGKAIRWAGGAWSTATTTNGSQNGTMYLSASKRAVIIFHFDGAKWVEVSRMIQ